MDGGLSLAVYDILYNGLDPENYERDVVSMIHEGFCLMLPLVSVQVYTYFSGLAASLVPQSGYANAIRPLGISIVDLEG